MSKKSPISKLALGFYAVAALSFLASLLPALFLGRMGIAGRGLFGSLGLALIIQPVLTGLFGGVVQMLADIRWGMFNRDERDNA